MSGNSQESQEVSGKAPGKSPFPSGMVHKNPGKSEIGSYFVIFLSYQCVHRNGTSLFKAKS